MCENCSLCQFQMNLQCQSLMNPKRVGQETRQGGGGARQKCTNLASMHTMSLYSVLVRKSIYESASYTPIQPMASGA